MAPVTSLRLDEDLHVHSAFSDGRSSVEENIAAAWERGLWRLGCVDHVRRDTPWVPEFVAEVRRLEREAGMRLVAGVEAKLLDTKGSLDVPEGLRGVDRVYVADHRFPFEDTSLHPDEMRELLEQDRVSPSRAIAGLLRAYRGSLLQGHRVVLAHAFSVLPKVGLSEAELPAGELWRLAKAMRRVGAWLEVDERWRCPSRRVLSLFATAGVVLVSSSDSHTSAGVGRYEYVAEVAPVIQALAASARMPHRGWKAAGE